MREFLDAMKASDPSTTMKQTNFDRYLEEQLQDPAFAARFEQAGEAWDVALQIAALRERAGLSQKELAKFLKTSQQQISRLESPSYEGHSLSSAAWPKPCMPGYASSSSRRRKTRTSVLPNPPLRMA